MTPAESADRARQAREYESLHNRLFLVRLLVTALALAAFHFAGGSAQMAAGLRAHCGAWWPLVNGLYILTAVFGFAAFTFPLSFYEEHVLEHRYGLSRQTFGGWLWDYLKGLLLELVLALVFFEVLYALYVVFSVGLSAVAPVLIMPLFHKFEPLDNPDLVARVTDFAQRAGLKVTGVFRWGLAEKTATANAALAGLGRTRRIILGDTLLTGYSTDEILAVLAHELGHQRHHDLTRLLLTGTTLAGLGFWLLHLVLEKLTAAAGLAGAADIAGFPILVFCLFLFSLVTMPLVHTYSRRREYAADAYAVATLGTAAPLTGALEKLALQNLDDREPAAWIEFLLHSHPSIARRVAAARAAEARR
ncbi:MAG: M48 family metalloprotease [Kiritimatiellaeota bacterium]|nr:M48 family metalloprotease [Kiritimatiellota bacterium]